MNKISYSCNTPTSPTKPLASLGHEDFCERGVNSVIIFIYAQVTGALLELEFLVVVDLGKEMSGFIRAHKGLLLTS